MHPLQICIGSTISIGQERVGVSRIRDFFYDLIKKCLVVALDEVEVQLHIK